MLPLRLARLPALLAPRTAAFSTTASIRAAAPFSDPPSKAGDLKGKAAGQVDLPDMAEIERTTEVRAKIPTAPDTYRDSSSSPDAEPAPFVPPPAVSTAAHPSTLPGGGPSLQHSGDDAIATGGEGLGGERGGHGGREERFEGEDRPLNDEERQGLWVLGGLLAGGSFVGWATDPRRQRKAPAV
ncbi:hypothetical protein JCM10450v2_001565 [Rhodotorula kratochvilovae]